MALTMTLTLLTRRLLRVLTRLLINGATITNINQAIILLLILRLLIETRLSNSLLLFLTTRGHSLSLLTRLITTRYSSRTVNTHSLIITRLNSSITLLGSNLDDEAVLGSTHRVHTTVNTRLINTNIGHVSTQGYNTRVQVGQHLTTSSLINGILNMIGKGDGTRTQTKTQVTLSRQISTRRLAIIIGRHTAQITQISNNVNLSRINVSDIAINETRNHKTVRYQRGTHKSELLITRQQTSNRSPLTRIRLKKVASLSQHRLKNINVLRLSSNRITQNVITRRLNLMNNTIIRNGRMLIVTVSRIIINRSITLNVRRRTQTSTTQTIQLINELQGQTVLTATQDNNGKGRKKRNLDEGNLNRHNILKIGNSLLHQQAQDAHHRNVLTTASVRHTTRGRHGSRRNSTNATNGHHGGSQRLFNLNLSRHILIRSLLTARQLTNLHIMNLRMKGIATNEHQLRLRAQLLLNLTNITHVLKALKVMLTRDYSPFIGWPGTHRAYNKPSLFALDYAPD